MIKNLLSVNADTKTIKGLSKGVLTGILYLAPGDISGFQVCPMASKGCLAACLYSAGRGAFSNVQQSRINKTKMFFNSREEFMALLHKNVASLERKAIKEGLIPAVRLNGTSDIVWEFMPVTIQGEYFENIMRAFPGVTFYDYTKRTNRHNLPANYSLTFSLAEMNVPDAERVAWRGINVAVVFRDTIPERYTIGTTTRPVIDGTQHDARFLDRQGVIVGLCAKGAARKDTSGFVRDVP